jgi:TRAP-type mannitol/chloroaromatic compound transport system substrate-binding protein
MNRRTFLIPARAEPLLEWNMATSWSEDLDLILGSLKFFCQRVSQLTEGRFSIKILNDPQKVAPLAVLDGVGKGTVDLGHTNMYYYVNRSPAFAFAATIPFGLTIYQQLSWLYQGGGMELIQPLFTAAGVVGLPCGSPGVQMGGWFRQEIQQIEDFRGLRVRIPGLGGAVLSRMGAKVTLLDPGEIFAALSQGRIDAAEWQNPYDDEKLGLHRAAKYYYSPGWWEPGLSNFLVINLQQWQKLSRTYQQVLEVAAAQAGNKMIADYNSNNAAALERLVQSGTILRTYSEPILRAAHQNTIAVLEEQSRTDGEFRRIYRPWRQFRQQIYQWNRINELSLERFMLQSPR